MTEDEAEKMADRLLIEYNKRWDADGNEDHSKGHSAEFRGAWEALIDALTATHAPEGWKLVPEKPNAAMNIAGDQFCGKWNGERVYAAMLAASPPAPAVSAAEAVAAELDDLKALKLIGFPETVATKISAELKDGFEALSEYNKKRVALVKRVWAAAIRARAQGGAT